MPGGGGGSQGVLTLVRLLELLHQLGVDLLAPLRPVDRLLGLQQKQQQQQYQQQQPPSMQ